jgi:hypothetical protein
MTVYNSEMVDQLRDLLDDSSDTQMSYLRKRHYLNAGMRAMWPRIHRIATDITTTFTDDDYEYTIPAAVRGGRMLTIEKSKSDDTDFFYMMDYDDYEIKHGVGGANIIVLKFDPGDIWGATGIMRFTAALPLTDFSAATYATAGSEAYTGPDYSAEGPVLYAMSRITIIPLDQRMDFGRLSVQQQNRAATPGEHLAVSAYWLDEFERRVDEWRMPLPVARY